jgi:hypothetical protein
MGGEKAEEEGGGGGRRRKEEDSSLCDSTEAQDTKDILYAFACIIMSFSLYNLIRDTGERQGKSTRCRNNYI